MSDEKKEKSIQEALDQMEQESAERSAYKERVNARIQKHMKPKVEKNREETIEKKALEQKHSLKFDLKALFTKYILLTVIFQYTVYKYIAKGDMVEYVFYNIAAACLWVMIMAKINKDN